MLIFLCAMAGLAFAFLLWLAWVYAFMAPPPPDYLEKYSGYLSGRYGGSTKFD